MVGRPPMSDGPKLGHDGSLLWFIPVACVLTGIALSVVTIALRAFEFELLSRWLTGGPHASIG